MNRILFASLIGTALLAAPAAFATTTPRPPLKYPVCDQAHSDHCIELGKYAFIDKLASKDYPQCVQVKNLDRRAACIESSYRAERHPT